MTVRSKEVILSLMKRIDELKKNDNMKHEDELKHVDELKLKLKIYRGLLAYISCSCYHCTDDLNLMKIVVVLYI
jgi:hypothetical protein